MSGSRYVYAGFTLPQVDALLRACHLMMTAHQHDDYTGLTPQGYRALVGAHEVLTRLLETKPSRGGGETTR